MTKRGRYQRGIKIFKTSCRKMFQFWIWFKSYCWQAFPPIFICCRFSHDIFLKYSFSKLCSMSQSCLSVEKLFSFQQIVFFMKILSMIFKQRELAHTTRILPKSWYFMRFLKFTFKFKQSQINHKIEQRKQKMIQKKTFRSYKF